MIIRTSTTLIAVCSTWMLIGCSDPRDTEIPTLSSIDAIQSSVNKLTDEERHLLKGYIERQLLPLSIAQDKVRTLDRITIRQAIGEQREWQLRQAIDSAERERRLAEGNAERIKKANFLANAVSFRLLDRNLTKSEDNGATSAPYNSLRPIGLELRLEITNNSGKHLNGIEGVLNVNDVFGNLVEMFPVAETELLRSGDRRTIAAKTFLIVNGSTVTGPGKALASAPLDKLKLQWLPKKLIFSDGSEQNRE